MVFPRLEQGSSEWQPTRGESPAKIQEIQMVVGLLILLSRTVIESLVDYLLFVQQEIFEIKIMCPLTF